MSEHLFVGREPARNGSDETPESDRLGTELLAPRGNGLLALALLRMRGHANDWNVPGLRIVLETPHGFPTVVVRHLEVHQDHIRVLSRGQPAALLAVLRCENLEAAAQFEARLEHVQIVVVVFDVEHFGHVADSVLLTDALITSSLDHLVGAGEQLVGNFEIERIDHQLEFGRLNYRQVGRLFAAENTTDVYCSIRACQATTASASPFHRLGTRNQLSAVRRNMSSRSSEENTERIRS